MCHTHNAPDIEITLIAVPEKGASSLILQREGWQDSDECIMIRKDSSEGFEVKLVNERGGGCNNLSIIEFEVLFFSYVDTLNHQFGSDKPIFLFSFVLFLFFYLTFRLGKKKLIII